MMLLLPAIQGCVGKASDLPVGQQAAANAVSHSVANRRGPPPDEYPVAPFTGDSFYQLLAAEVAGYRDHHQVALEKYVAMAEQTRDPGVARRATRLALYMKQHVPAIKSSLIWVQEAPDDREAHHITAELLLQEGRIVEAIKPLRKIWEMGDQVHFELMAHSSSSLAPEHRATVLKEVTGMLAEQPDDTGLITAQAILLEQQGDHEAALAAVESLPGVADNHSLLILQASLLVNLERQETAWELLEDAIDSTSNNRRLRLALAQMLFKAEALDAAKEQYNQVLQAHPDDVSVVFALALIALAQEDDETAKGYLELMVRRGSRVGEAHFYLGDIAERAGDTETAMREYRQAGAGYVFIPALVRLASILADEGRWQEARGYFDWLRQRHPDRGRQLTLLEASLLAESGLETEALELLDALLNEKPNDIELLFSRAMTALQFKRLGIMETDLRKIIDLDPNNADAMNTLGYTLTNLTDRHAEALLLIEKALVIKPDEAAFIDSMGWVQYRLQNYDEALVHLRRALEMFQNDEIAAHLGEVLWVTGQRAEAIKVWDKALELAPESEILLETVKRLRGP